MSTKDLVADVPGAFLESRADDVVIPHVFMQQEFDTLPTNVVEAGLAVQSIPWMTGTLNRAQASYELGMSWRNFKVGSVVAGYASPTASKPNRIGFFTGYNVKEQSGESKYNIHAEQMGLAKARLAGMDRILGVAVVANADDEDANPLGRETLRPCGRCLDMFATSPEIDQAALILTASVDLQTCQLFSLGDLWTERSTQVEAAPLALANFALQTEIDLDTFDQTIIPELIEPVRSLYIGADPGL